MKQCRAQELFWAMLYLDTEKCKQRRFLVPKVSDKCRKMVLSALSRARLYSDEARCGESVAAAGAPIGLYLPSHLREWPLRADRTRSE